ncbi:hypothetical protein ABZ746_29600 [Streptomyces sp. NPDC020096]
MRPDENPPTTGRAEWSRLAKLRASRELDELIERIRTEPGFDDFLRPLSAQQLRQLAADGPIVVLNHAQRYCHALVVTARSITALRLDAESAEISDAARRQRDSTHAEHVTREFYRRVAGGGMDTPACALHHTIRELRRQMPERPHVWAAYVHAGT